MIEAEPTSLQPIESIKGESLSILEDKEVLNSILNLLIKKKEKNFDSLSYQDRLKSESVKSQIIKII